jgi:hypothetical protein
MYERVCINELKKRYQTKHFASSYGVTAVRALDKRDQSTAPPPVRLEGAWYSTDEWIHYDGVSNCCEFLYKYIHCSYYF